MWLLCTIYSCIQVTVNCWITPFGHPGVKRYVLLTPAFRSLSRPSSPYGSQASAINLYSLDHIILSALYRSHSAPRGLFIQASPFKHSQYSSSFRFHRPSPPVQAFPFLPLRFQTPSCFRCVPAASSCVSLTGRGKKEITSKSTDLCVLYTYT